MKIDIDETVCKKHGLTIEQVLLLLAVKQSKDFKETRQVLYNKNLLTNSYYNAQITEKGIQYLDDILSTSSEITNYEEWITGVSQSLIKTFPQGKIPGSAYYYRCNIKEVVNKLKRFFVKHPEYKPSIEIGNRIIEAGKRYNLEKDKDPRYRVTVKYFISKLKPIADEDGIVHNEETSLLASYLENENQENTVPKEDWMLNFKN